MRYARCRLRGSGERRKPGFKSRQEHALKRGDSLGAAGNSEIPKPEGLPAFMKAICKKTVLFSRFNLTHTPDSFLISKRYIFLRLDGKLGGYWDYCCGSIHFLQSYLISL